MQIMISIDDGSRLDMKVLDLLEKHKLTDVATFYIAPYNPNLQMLSRSEIKIISNAAEIGGHTLNHVLLTRVPKDVQLMEIMQGNSVLQEITGKKVEKFAYPKGWYNDDTIESVKECGIKMARTMKLCRTDLDGENMLAIPISFHVYPRKEYNRDILGAFRNVIDAAKIGGYLGVVLHSDEIEKFGLWEELNIIFYEIALSRN